MSGPRLRLGTRSSLLARTQAQTVADAIAATGTEVELVPMTSTGDITRASLASLGGAGVFAAGLREALLAGECDAVVHSYKDLPTAPHPGLRAATTPRRADHRDVLCARAPLAELPPGARIGTGSPRRRAQLLSARSDLEVVDVRGNIDTRLRMVTDGDLDGVVLAAAGLERIGRTESVSETFGWPTAPAQGALVVETREDVDAATAGALAAIHHAPTWEAVQAERTVLAVLEVGCAAPVAATARIERDRIDLLAVAYATDGSDRSTVRIHTPVTGDGSDIGAEAARRLLDAGVSEGLG